MSAERGRRFGVGLAVIVLVALALHVTYIVGFARQRDLGWDATFYHSAANSLAAGEGYTVTCPLIDSCSPRVTAVFPPLYPVTLAAASIVGLRSPLAHELESMAFVLGAVALIGGLGRRFGGDRVGWIAAGIAAVNPLWITLEGALMSESLTVLLTAALLVLLYRAIERPGLLRWTLVGAVVGLCVLTHGEGTAWLVFLAWPAILTSRSASWPRRLGYLALTTAVAVAVVLPWVARNDRDLGAPLLSQPNVSATISGANCDRTYEPGPDRGWWVECWEVRHDGQTATFANLEAVGMTEPELYDATMTPGLDYARSHPSRWPVVGSVRLLRAWNVVHPFEFQTGAGFMRTLISPFGWFLLVGGAFGFVILVRRRSATPWWPLLTTVGVVFVTIVVTYGNQRFRVSAEPALAIAAAVAADWVIRRAHE